MGWELRGVSPPWASFPTRLAHHEEEGVFVGSDFIWVLMCYTSWAASAKLVSLQLVRHRGGQRRSTARSGGLAAGPGSASPTASSLGRLNADPSVGARTIPTRPVPVAPPAPQEPLQKLPQASHLRLCKRENSSAYTPRPTAHASRYPVIDRRASFLFGSLLDTPNALRLWQDAALKPSLWLGTPPPFREGSKEASRDLSHPLPQCHPSQLKVTSAPATQLARTG